MRTLAARIGGSPDGDQRSLIITPDGALCLADLKRPTTLVRKGACASHVVAISMRSPVGFIRALLELDGLANGVLLLAPTLDKYTALAVAADVGATLLVSDREELEGTSDIDTAIAECKAEGSGNEPEVATQWFLTTSGTTGRPKTVSHSIEGLTRCLRTAKAGTATPRWGLLYDPSRFAGLQVVLQSLLGGGVLLAPNRDWAWTEQLSFLARNQCTHLSATPTLWRKILMAQGGGLNSLQQVTLGGEISDAPLLRSLARQYPQARITHIYASTEAGVGFSVRDGQAGFPRSFLDEPVDGVELKIVDDILWIRPAEIGGQKPGGNHIVRDEDGFIRSGDGVRIEDNRVYFAGREDGVVNIAGVKLQIETVESIVLEHPDVAACRVVARRSPLVGALLQFEVVPRDKGTNRDSLLAELKIWCRLKLQREAQPSSIKVVDEITMSASGKTPRS